MRAQSPMTFSSSTTNGGITELQLWAVREGLRRAPAAPLFEDFCRRLIASGVPLWRAFAGMRTLHPQWAGYTYTWLRDRDAVQPTRRERGRQLLRRGGQQRGRAAPAGIRPTTHFRSWPLPGVSQQGDVFRRKNRLYARCFSRLE